MLEDHYIICEARDALCNALKVLLYPEIMGASEFQAARDHTQQAMNAIDKLLERLGDLKS